MTVPSSWCYVILGYTFTIGPHATSTIGPNVTVYFGVIFELKALSAGDLRWGSKNVPLPSLHHTLCIYVFCIWFILPDFLGMSNLFLGGEISIFFRGIYIFAATM